MSLSKEESPCKTCDGLLFTYEDVWENGRCTTTERTCHCVTDTHQEISKKRDATTKAMSRATMLGVDAVRRLDHFATFLDIMFRTNVGVVHCGSSLDRRDYRDVDVRVVLKDDDYQTLARLTNVLDLNMLLSGWGQRVTDLPIDCQAQSVTESGTHGTRHGITRAARYRDALDVSTSANPKVTAET